MRIIFRCDPILADVLPRPVPARGALPDWLRAMPATAYSAIHGREIRTLKQCPPVVDAMVYGFMILLPCDVSIDKGVFSWNWDIRSPATERHPRSPLSFHTPGQLTGSPFEIAGQAAIKFNSFWTIQVDSGWSLFATHPINRADLPFRVVTGLVDSDRFTDGGINFPAIWTEPEFSGVLTRGTPVAQCFAVPRSVPELVFEELDEQRQTAYAETVGAVLSTPGVYRKRFRAKRGRSAHQ